MCMRALRQYMRKLDKEVNEDDIRNPIQTFATTFDFVREDIQAFREQ